MLDRSTRHPVDVTQQSALSRLIFPFHILKSSPSHDDLKEVVPSCHFSCHRRLFSPFTARSILFNTVFASEKDENHSPDDKESIERMKYSKNLENLARAYIHQETGWERVQSIFHRDHRGLNNREMNYIQLTLTQVFILTFFIKYFPAARFARKEFIRENRGTVFRTRIEAVRRLQDHTSVRAGAEGAVFATKVTCLSASFLLLSSAISQYRNKTTVLEYTIAAGVTGGLSRINLGIMGFLAGSLVGSVLGTAVGVIGYVSLSAYGFTQEERHLEAIMEKLEVWRSVEGESQFKERVGQLLSQDTTLSDPSS